MRTMKHLISSAAAKLAALTLGCAALCASTVHAAGFDGKSLTTNDWFDVGFSDVAADTAIAAGSTTGITLGAGSWTVVPTSGEAVVLSDKTLSIDTDSGEALTLTPAASPATGMETVAVKVKANVSTSLETPEDSPITAFALYNDGTAVKPAVYVSGGWTNLVYANVADLTNGWFTLYIDYADVDNVKSVRFSVQPDGGAVTVLKDSQDATWFTSASSATKISSLSFCGSGLCQTISGDTHQSAVAQVNGVNYATFAAAIDAAEAYAATHDGAYPTITVLNGATEQDNTRWKIVDGYLVRSYFYKDDSNANLWHIANLDGLIDFRKSVNNKTTYSGKTIQLDADIDMAGVAWLPIGGGTTEDVDTSETWQNYYFAGTFDGQNHVISNLTVALTKEDSRTSNRVGLFGFVNGGTVKDLVIENVDLTGGWHVAPVAGRGDGATFSGITVRGTVNVDAVGYVSGLVANAYTGNVRNCVVNGTLDISGEEGDTGGIAGSGYANVSDCVVVGVGNSVISGGEFTGGIKGYSGEGNVKVESCSVSNVTVVATSCGAGGVFGCLQYGNRVIDCNVYDVTVVGNKPINSGVIGLIAGSSLGTESSPSFIYGCSVSNSTATVDGMQTFSLCGDMNWDGESNGNGYVYFNSDKTSTVNNNTVALTNGTYTASPETAVAGKTAVSVAYTAKSYVAEGYAVTDNGNGTWTIGTPTPVAMIYDTPYYSLADAVLAAYEWDDIVLLADIALDSTLVLDKSLYIYGAEDGETPHTLTGTVKVSAAADPEEYVSVEISNLVFGEGSTIDVSDRGDGEDDHIYFSNVAVEAGSTITIVAGDLDGRKILIDSVGSLTAANFTATLTSGYELVKDTGALLAVKYVASVVLPRTGTRKCESIEDAIYFAEIFEVNEITILDPEAVASAPEGWEIADGKLVRDPYAYLGPKVADGFYQDAATYVASTDFYITSKAGLEYFRDLVNGVWDANTNYCSFAGTTTNAAGVVSWHSNNLFRDKTVHLMCDVDLENEDWTPIGYYQSSLSVTYPVVGTENETTSVKLGKIYFYGLFDAGIYEDGVLVGSHKISNLNASYTYGQNYSSLSKSYQSTGLFGLLGGGPSSGVKNLIIENATVAGRQYVGAVAGRVYNEGATIENCHLIGIVNVNGSAQYVGGLVGDCRGTVTKSSVVATGTVSGTYCVGGLTGGIFQHGSAAEVGIYSSAVSNITVSTTSYAYGLGALSGNASLDGDNNKANVIVTGCDAYNVTVTTSRNDYNGKVGLLVGFSQANNANGYTILSNNTVSGTTSATQSSSAVNTFIGQGNVDYVIVGKDIVYDGANKVTGGIFEVIPDAVIADGLERIANTDPTTSAEYPYTVGIPQVAQIGDVTYTTLAAAIDAAEEYKAEHDEYPTITVLDADAAAAELDAASDWKISGDELVRKNVIATLAQGGALVGKYEDLHVALEAGKAVGSVVTLLVDVDLDGVTWVPVADFAGTFDGNNKTISNLTINDNTLYPAGLFSVTGYGATIKNLTLDDPTVIGGKENIGALVGKLWASTVTNCHVTGAITVSGYHCVGGLTGFADYSQVVDCSIVGDSKATASVVGIYDDDIEDGDNVGGLIGMGGTASPLYSSIEVMEPKDLDKEATIGCTVRNITVKGTRKVGGLVGQIYSTCSVSNAVVSSVNVTTTATEEFASKKSSTMGVGGMAGMFVFYTDSNTGKYGRIGQFAGKVSDVNVTSENAAVDAYAWMGVISGGQRDASTDFVIPQGLTFAVTVKGKNLTTGAHVTDNTTAIYSAKPVTCSVTFDLGTNYPTGAEKPADGAYAVGEELPLPNYESANTSFAGWKVDGSDPAVIIAVVPADVASPIALVATWIGTKTVTVTESETTVSINVTDDWIEKNVTVDEGATPAEVTAAVEEALNKPEANGLPAWQNYVLGQDPDASVAADAVQGAVDAMPVVSTVTPQTVDTGFKVEYRLDAVDASGNVVASTEAQATPDLTVDLTKLTPENNVAYYKTVAVITSEENPSVTVTVPSSNTVGVLMVESEATSTVIAVPWEALSDDGGIKVADLVRTATLSEGDELKVYDPNTGTYKVWTLNSSKEWEPNTTVTESGSSLAPSAYEYSVPRGVGVWLTRTDTTQPIYLVGEVAEQSTTTTIAGAQGNEPTWNLVAAPTVEAVNLNVKFPNANEGDVVLVPTDGAPKRYTYKDGSWGYDDYVKTVNKRGIEVVKVERNTDVTNVPIGTGFWYMNAGDAKNVEW